MKRGRIVIDVTAHGEPPNEVYNFSINYPDGVHPAHVARVVRIAARGLDREADRCAAEGGSSL